MNAEKRKRLEEAGFKVGSTADFLGLGTEESELIEIKVALSSALKRQRRAADLSQHTLAKRIASSQSRVAKMEAGDPSVSLDLLIRSLIMTGMTRDDIADAITARPEMTCTASPSSRHLSLLVTEEQTTQYRFPARPRRPALEAYSPSERFLKVQVA